MVPADLDVSQRPFTTPPTNAVNHYLWVDGTLSLTREQLASTRARGESEVRKKIPDAKVGLVDAGGDQRWTVETNGRLENIREILDPLVKISKDSFRPRITRKEIRFTFQPNSTADPSAPRIR